MNILFHAIYTNFMIPDLSTEQLQSLKEVILKAKYIVFDFDDTLVLSMHLWDKLDELCVKKLNLDIDLTKYKDKFHGFTLDNIAKFVKTEFKLEKSEDEIKNVWLETMRELFEDVQPIEGAVKFLRILNELSNKPKIGVASASSAKFVQELAKKLGLISFVDCITSCEEHNISKPDPDVFYTSLEKLGYVNPRTEEAVSNVVIFEDSIPGLTAAKNVKGSKVVCLIVRDYKIDEKLQLSDWQMEDYVQLVNTMQDM